MFAVIHLSQFALQAALRHEPELWFRPVALVDSTVNAPRVCDLTATARAAGVMEGLSPPQALARCRELLIRRRSPAQETAATAALLQCAYGFSPNIENTAPGTCSIDLRGLMEISECSEASSPLPSPLLRAGERVPAERERGATKAGVLHSLPLRAWSLRLRTALAALNLHARIGAGLTPNVARHAARWSDAIEIVSDPAIFLASLPVGALEPSTDAGLILRKWGIGTVGELLALGQAAVVERLGLEALALFAAASPVVTRPLSLVRPVESFEESFEFDQPVEMMEPLLFLLRRFVDQISQRLEASGLVAAVLILRLPLESGVVLERRLCLPQPTREAGILFRMLHTHLERVRSDSAILAVSLKAEPTAAMQRQFGLFEAAVGDPHQFQETLARLSALVGADRVGTPVRENGHRPDAFKLVPPDFENAPAPLGQRVAEILRAMPLRRFRPALPARVETAHGAAMRRESQASSEAFLPQEMTTPSEEDTTAINTFPSPPPVSIRCALAKGNLKPAFGPWRASGQWWDSSAWQQEEWDVQTRDGKTLRLVHRQDGWFVEAMVD